MRSYFLICTVWGTYWSRHSDLLEPPRVPSRHVHTYFVIPDSLSLLFTAYTLTTSGQGSCERIPFLPAFTVTFSLLFQFAPVSYAYLRLDNDNQH